MIVGPYSSFYYVTASIIKEKQRVREWSLTENWSGRAEKRTLKFRASFFFFFLG
jgi:hypothetical protein